MERLDRNTIELLNEIRVAATGIQVMFAFLLIVPFNSSFRSLSSFDHTDYYVTLLCVAVSAVLLLAPTIHHRILFRHHQKGYLVDLANRIAIVSMAFLGVGFTGILVLLSDVVVGGWASLIVGILAGLGIGALWFGLPLSRRRR